MAFLSKREIKLYLGIVGLVTLLALFVTVLIIMIGRSGEEPSARPDGGAAELPEGGEFQNDIFSPQEEVVSQMEVPDDYRALFRPEWKEYRQIHGSWSRAQIEAFWVEPEKIVEQQLEKESDKAVETFLKELP